MTAPGRTAEEWADELNRRIGDDPNKNASTDAVRNAHTEAVIRDALRAAEAPLRERVRVLESLLATAVHYHEYAPGVVHVASCETSVGKPCDCWMPAARAALKEPPRG